MLMDGRAFNEGARALILWGALQVDLAKQGGDAGRAAAGRRPDLAADPGHQGLLHRPRLSTSPPKAQQVYGGHGYIREWGMEQFVRDARIAQIYEGTNGIQAMDLVGRKLGMNGGRGTQAYLALVNGALAEAKGDDRLTHIAAPLEKALGDLQAATMWLLQNGMTNPNNAGAGATAYLHLMGIVALGHMWLLMAKASHEALDGGDDGSRLLRGQAGHRALLCRALFPRCARAARQAGGRQRGDDGDAGARAF